MMKTLLIQKEKGLSLLQNCLKDKKEWKKDILIKRILSMIKKRVIKKLRNRLYKEKISYIR